MKKIVKKANSILSIFLLSIFASQCFAQSSVNADKKSNFQYLKKLNSVFDFVQQNYVDEVDPKILYEGAMKGLMESLNDPYTSYLDESIQRDLSDTTAGHFGGVGLMISKAFESKPDKPAYVEVSSAMEDTPGARAGIQAGDFIVEIDGDPTDVMTMQDVLAHLRGKVGTPVTVTILRGKTLRFKVDLVRALIEVPTCKYAMIGKTGYVRLIQFTPETASRLQDAIDYFKENSYESMILDLRDNGGGLITSAVNVVDKFVDEGLIVSTKGRLDFQNSSYSASPEKTTVKNVPVVVLINKGSASASEIVSGALKDHHVAYLVGNVSYGKGSVQQVIPLGNDEEIKMTIARYYSPSDTNIDKVGIVPDLEVSYPKLSDENEKSYVKLMEANVISEYVENHPDMTESDIADYAKQLKTEYDLEERLLRRLVRMQVNRHKSDIVYDLDFDIQLNAALEILSDKASFREKVENAKTLKELQVMNEEKIKEEKADQKVEE